MTLLSVQAFGALFSAILLLICLVLVHAFRLAGVGYRSMKRKQPEKKEPSAEKDKAEPVYYIVERKKKRPKAEYSDPKRFQFK